ncbi:hypothetical protein Tco_1114915, partial [Tanacetum coccineum]
SAEYKTQRYQILAECKASANSEGLAECKTSGSNLRRIQVKDIVKEVEDYLKTYSSAGMDISWILDTLHLPPLRIQPRISINRECCPIISETIPPIPPPLGTNVGNIGSPNRVDTMPTTNDTINTTTTNNVAQNVVDENLPQLLDSRGDGPFVPLSNLSTATNPLRKPQNQWTHAEARLANQDKILKSIIISCLPNDVMKAVIKCKTTKAMWNDLILSHERPFDTRDTKIAALRLKFNAFKALEVNATFVNSLPRKWLNMNQTQRANNSIKNDCLATLYRKYNYEEGLIDQMYESETQRFTIQVSSSKALISNNQFQDSDSNVEEDLRSSSEFIADLNVEYHERALLANLFLGKGFPR